MYILRLFIVLALCFCGIALAWGDDMRTIEADFEQYIKNEDGMDIIYRGKIFAKTPNKAKWDYKIPFKKEIYMNDNQVMIYEPHLEQVSRSALQTKSDFISIIQSAKKQKDGSYTTNIDNIEYTLYVDKNDKPERISFVDSMGTKNTIKFSNVKLNGAINDKIFVFSPPKGVEIVDIRTR